jgi:hypothetical protein
MSLSIKNTDKRGLTSILISFINFQFISSFFSVYFLQLFLNITLIRPRLNRIALVRSLNKKSSH